MGEKGDKRPHPGLPSLELGIILLSRALTPPPFLQEVAALGPGGSLESSFGDTARRTLSESESASKVSVMAGRRSGDGSIT